MHRLQSRYPGEGLDSPPFNLETSVGRVRVCVFAAFWHGCSRGFVRHAARLRNSLRLPAQTRPARATTTQASPCEEEGEPLVRRNGQGAAKACNRARSVLTERVVVEKALEANGRADLRVIASGQLRFLGSSPRGCLSIPQLFTLGAPGKGRFSTTTKPSFS